MPQVMNKKAPDIVWNNKKDECHPFLLVSVCDQIRALQRIERLRKRRKGKVVWLQLKDFIGNISQPKDNLVRVTNKKLN